MYKRPPQQTAFMNKRKRNVKMYKDKVVLCGASAYEQKYYFNQDFSALPQQIKDELQIMCVMYTEEIGGILTLEFDEEGNLQFQVEALEADAMFDDIGSVLRIKELRKTKKELLESLELYYRVFFLGKAWRNRLCCWLLM